MLWCMLFTDWVFLSECMQHVSSSAHIVYVYHFGSVSLLLWSSLCHYSVIICLSVLYTCMHVILCSPFISPCLPSFRHGLCHIQCHGLRGDWRQWPCLNNTTGNRWGVGGVHCCRCHHWWNCYRWTVSRLLVWATCSPVHQHVQSINQLAIIWLYLISR